MRTTWVAVLLPCVSAWRRVLPRGGASVEESALRSFAAAFSERECDAIEELFEAQDVERDERVQEGISRSNRWLKPAPAALDWVIGRVLEKVPADDAFWGFDDDDDDDDDDAKTRDGAWFRRRVDFALMHEFGAADFFDWHVDTKPRDGTARTINVNVALSQRTAFEGGELQVGSANATLARGDLHLYPASLPHKVHDIARGRRRTLVLAVRARAEPHRSEEGQRERYWLESERRLEQLCAAAPYVAKLHWIYAEFLQARGREACAVRKFADSYRATPERASYVAHFAAAAAEKHAAGDLAGARHDLALCAAIEPTDPEYATDLGVVLWRLGELAASEAALRDALAASEADAAPAIRAALSLVLRDAGQAAHADHERHAAFGVDAAQAQAALDMLEQLR